MTAAYYGNIKIIRLLLEFNANLDMEDINGKKALQLAEEMKNFDCVELLQKEIGNSKKLTLKSQTISNPIKLPQNRQQGTDKPRIGER